jgi:16S rRNA (cytosine1402-N4)-methyltransferase
MNGFHTAVLLKEVVEHLKIERGKRYIDATIGGGGHTFEILKRGGIVLGIDVDQDAVEYIKEEVKSWERLTLVRGNFRDIDKIASEQGFSRVSGILFDLGVSSHQLETPERGFSFQKIGPLDMRMDQELEVKALDLIKILTKGELYELLIKLGEESSAREVSRAIFSARKLRPIKTTKDLASILEGGKVTSDYGRAMANRKVFQALRIAVNDELNALRDSLPKAVELLEERARLLVISFHSLEDRIVKNNFIDFEKRGLGKIITEKPITPGRDELERNKRSRSAKLRVFEKN